MLLFLFLVRNYRHYPAPIRDFILVALIVVAIVLTFIRLLLAIVPRKDAKRNNKKVA